MSLTISDICNDLKTFLESICRTCSRIDNGDGDLQFKRIFANANEASTGIEEDSPKYHRPSDELREVFDEILLWKLNIEPCDGLPQQICQECFERFNDVKHLRNICLDTQTLLKSYINHVDTLLESSSLGRLSPRAAESVKSEAVASSPMPVFLPDDWIEESPETPERTVISQNNSPRLSPKYEHTQQNQSPRSNIEAVYAESYLGTPPPLFDEINTEPIDMETLEILKAESDLEMNKVNSAIPIAKTLDALDPLNYGSSSSEDESDDGAANEYIVKRALAVQCNICFATFPKSTLLKEHQLLVHPQEAAYTCNICSKAFKSKFLLSQHKYKHSRLDSLICDKCGKHFRSQLHLQRHHKNFHLTSTFTCHICKETFENYTQLRFQYHVRQHGEKRFECQYCEKSFHQKIHQINHERTHTGEQPFSCDVCGKCYRQQTDCRDHMLKHKNPTPYKCSVCSKGYTQRSSLREHKRSHSNNNINTSNTSNNNNNNQDTNMTLHQVNTNPHHKLGSNTQLLNINAQGFAHKVLHCKFCDKSFQKQQLLLIHIQQSHGINIEDGDVDKHTFSS
ncbi:gastrula zinc finger protein XlCGF48.2-like [Eurosta solidaginis]|uniref:gastrula zinc finger protein XlCGF48.2-like n=1 Tax=Eurosta solidaginis TaxID=178769 RepID=UPI003530DDF0